MKINQFIEQFEIKFPRTLAYDWDNIGLQVGNENSTIANILVSLDLTLDVVDEAIDKDVNLIVVHHPVIFRPIKNIVVSTYLGKILHKLIENKISVYVAHTNFDISNHGMNQILADILKLRNKKVIEMVTDLEGLGVYGSLETPLPLWEFVMDVKKKFQLESVDLISNKRNDFVVKTVGICGGSGSDLLKNNKMNQVDVYITGDITYHYALDAINNGLTILDVGHYIEKIGFYAIKKTLEDFSSEYSVFTSTLDTNPYKKL